MKTKFKFLKHLLTLCGTVATTAAFGQTVYTWTNAAAIDFGASTNWTPNGQPSGATQDTAQWDGVVAGNLSLQYITALPSTGFGSSGINLVLTANQTGNVTIVAPAAGSPPVGIFSIANNSASAALTLGDNTTHLLNLATRPGTAGTVHNFVNNSSQPATLGSSIAWVAGGGVACVMDFGGTGDWIVNHVLRDNNSGAGPVTVTLDGPGTMNWSSGGTFLSSDPLGPININGGTIVLKSAGLALNFSGQANTIVNSGTLKYDAGVADTIARVISGTGALQVSSGTLTLSGASTYTGNTTLSGGTLVLGVAHNPGVSGPIGVGGNIVFNGGTLQFSAANTFDYSTRFSTSPNQAYKLDTGGQSVTLTNALTSSGGTLTKLGSGTLTLSGANTYGGLTTVSAGKLVIQGSAGSGGITVANSTTLGVNQGGAQITPSTLTVGTSSSATLEFNGVNSAATAAIAAGSVVAGGPITINVASGSFLIGQTYPLITWTSGSAPAVALGTLTGAGGNLSTNGNTIQLNITSLAFVWTGIANGNWDTTTANNWKVNGVSQIFANGGTALFDDTVTSGNTNLTLNSPVSPASVTVNSVSNNYSITSSGANLIGGASSLTKNGNSTLALAGGVNTYSGVTTLGGGTTSVGALANGGSASDIGAAGSSAANLVFNGGALQYTNGGAVAIDRLFTLGTGGGTIDASGTGALNLTNGGAVALSGTGARVLTLTGSSADDNTLAAKLSDNGGATSLAKSGAGKWILTGNNTNSGTVSIAAGTLQVGTGGAAGSLGSGNISDNGSLIFNTSSTLTNGTITGTGSIDLEGSGTIILPGNNTYAGGTTINAGTLQIGNGGATGTMDPNDPIANNGTLIVNSTGNLTLSGVISGAGQLIKRGSGLLQILGANSYTGGTTIDTGAQLQICQGNNGANASPVITNNGTLIMMRQDNATFIYSGNIIGIGSVQQNVSNGNEGDSTLTGSNTYTGGTFILGGGIVLGDNSTPGAGSIVGDVFLTNNYARSTGGAGTYINATLTFNRPDDFTFPGNIVGDGRVIQQGSGTVTLTGNNTYTNGTTINAGTLQVGNGGTSGSFGSGSVANNSLLVFNRSDSVTISRNIGGAGAVVKTGAGILTLSANTTYTGITTVSNGTLIVNGANAAASTAVNGGTLGGAGTLSGPVTLDAGTTLAPGATAGTIKTLTINNDLTIGGNLAFNVNKSVSPSNDTVVVSGALTQTGTGTLAVTNLGSALAAGDKFTLFSQPVANGAALTVTGGGATWTNNLAVDGSITVLTVPATVNTNRPVMQVAVTGNTLSLAWPTNRGWTLQTNSVGLAAANQWFTYPGSASLTNVNITINPAKPSVFFRMVYTNTP